MSRKPHAGEPGFVAERKCRAGGHAIIYDRARLPDRAENETRRWSVVYSGGREQPFGISCRTQGEARATMKRIAEARADLWAAALDGADVDAIASFDQPNAAPGPARADHKPGAERHAARPRDANGDLVAGPQAGMPCIYTAPTGRTYVVGLDTFLAEVELSPTLRKVLENAVDDGLEYVDRTTPGMTWKIRRHPEIGGAP